MKQGGTSMTMVIDTSTSRLFMNGHCESMALALHERTGWAVVDLANRKIGGIHTAVVLSADPRFYVDVCGIFAFEGTVKVRTNPYLQPRLGGTLVWRKRIVEHARQFVDAVLYQVEQTQSESGWESRILASHKKWISSYGYQSGNRDEFLHVNNLLAAMAANR
jgi:hypothetical protein